MAKIIVGLSGGVDSAVSALLLKQAGHEVIGVFMRNWDSALNSDILGNPNLENEVCPEESDWEDVQTIGQQLGIEVRRVDFVRQYWEQVFQDLIDQYQQGLTPNPDILCNKYIKFGHFLAWVRINFPDAEFVATGHYAKLNNNQLLKPHDLNKDQTYFLAQISAQDFPFLLFPLQDLTKEAVRAIALEHNLIVAKKRDSVGICFIGKRDFTAFLQNYIPAQPGNIVDIRTHEILGQHQGAMYYTIGKRSGIGLSGMIEPYYVCGHDLAQKIVYVAPSSDRRFLTSYQAIIKNVNWFITKETTTKHLEVKFRYRSQSVNCTITWLDASTLQVNYPEGFEAVTPGQQAVFYNQDLCLGGGMISQVFDQQGLKTYL